jgi:hypothetical protein
MAMNFNIMHVSFRFKNNRMNKIVLFLLTLCVVTSCTKTVKVPLSYSVEAANDYDLRDVYILDSATTNVPIVVKFLTGYHQDPVTLSVHGLPQLVTVSPDTFTAVPTFTKDFAFTTHKLATGTYPITVVSSAPSTVTKTYNVNLIVIPNDCKTLFLGSAAATNSCSGREYTYTVFGTGTNSKNAMYINNLGGYGVHTNTYVLLSCESGGVYVPRQNIGNGVIIEGSGTFNANKMTINYNAENIPGGGNESCTATLTK